MFNVMKKICLFTFLIMLIPVTLEAQHCNCEENYQWVKKTFEDNDAGFQYIIDQKGKDAYEAHNQKTFLSVKNIRTVPECQQELIKWLKFFRKEHFGVAIKNQNNNETKTSNPPEFFNIDEKRFLKHINSLSVPGLEGIWSTGTYKIGIIKTKENYTGFILDAPNTGWKKNQVKLKIASDGKTCDYWMRDFTKLDHVSIELIGNNFIRINRSINLRRESTHFPDSKNIENYITFLTQNQPYFQKLSAQTNYLRIPSFDLEYKKNIDSIISSNLTSITGSKNLIIDIRNNGGGGDSSYKNIIPLLYTNPIRTVGVAFYSTKLNNEAILKYAQNPNLSQENRDFYKKFYEKLNQNLGKYVSLTDQEVSVKELDKIMPNPVNVAIIINEANASSAEQFLLTAKQSRKVKLFGTTTLGALDISNQTEVDSPDGNFEFWYCMSKSYRIPEMTVDNVGIQPDYYIDRTVSEENWLDFVQKTLED